MLNAIRRALTRPLQRLPGECALLFELCQGGLIIQDAHGHLLQVNRAFADMLGHAAGELAGCHWRDLVANEDGVRALEALLERPWQPGESRDAAVRLRTRDTHGTRNVVVRLRPMSEDGDEMLAGSVTDVTDLRRGETALRDYARRLQLLSRQVIDVQESERANLARELHDEIGQQLTLVKLSLDALRGSGPNPVLDEALESVAQLTRQVRDLSLDLRPSMLDDFGLVPALRWYLHRATRLAEIRAVFDVDEQFPRLHTSIETLFFRIAQEAITNTLRHSGAASLAMRVGIDAAHVTMTIVDDGRGFDVGAARTAALAGRSAGLLGMQERAALVGATLGIESQAGAGTRLRLELPRERAGVRAVNSEISGAA